MQVKESSSVLYVCDVCGSSYNTEQEALDCENLPIELFDKGKVGDILETPLIIENINHYVKDNLLIKYKILDITTTKYFHKRPNEKHIQIAHIVILEDNETINDLYIRNNQVLSTDSPYFKIMGEKIKAYRK